MGVMRWFKRSMLVGALAAGLLWSGCTGPSPGAGASSSSGSLALSSDDALLFAVDTDNGIVAVVDTAKNAKVAEVRVGAQPSRVVVTRDDVLFVSNRGSRSVSVIRRGEWAEAARLNVGIEPVGLALSPDNRTVYVTSATSLESTEYGTLSAFDTSTFAKLWEVNVGEEPRGVAVVGDGTRALVTLYKKGEVVEVDLVAGEVLKAKLGIYEKANQSLTSTPSSTPRAPVSSTASTFHPRGTGEVVATPDGTRAFVPTTWARETAITIRPNPSTGYYGSQGPCSVGAVTAPGMVTVDTTAGAEPWVDDLTNCASLGSRNEEAANFPKTSMVLSAFGARTGEAVQGPSVAVVDGTGSWLFVVNKETRNLAVLPTSRRTGEDLSRSGTSIRTLVEEIGHGVDGIALSKDGSKAYVYSQFDHQVQAIAGTGRGPSATLAKVGAPVRVANDTLPADLAVGRKLFFDAKDARVSGATVNVACSTCHLEGRDDGHVWQFPDGPRQTPSLGGRRLLATAPFHWSGEFQTIDAFNKHTIRERMGGSGLDAEAANRLDRFADALAPVDRPMNMGMPAVQRGRAAFEKAQCANCHTGELMTNNRSADVGTRVASGNNPDRFVGMEAGFNVPSLLGVSRTAPYLHDGSETSLAQRAFGNTGDRHGRTSELSNAEKTDLVAYLKSL